MYIPGLDLYYQYAHPAQTPKTADEELDDQSIVLLLIMICPMCDIVDNLPRVRATKVFNHVEAGPKSRYICSPLVTSARPQLRQQLRRPLQCCC